jgi:hypothetical protein
MKKIFTSTFILLLVFFFLFLLPSFKPVLAQPTECSQAGGTCEAIGHGVCPDKYKSDPIGGPGEMGCSGLRRCCAPRGTEDCVAWNPVTRCPGYIRCPEDQTRCCRDTTDCPTSVPRESGSTPKEGCPGNAINTAIGCIPVDSQSGFIGFILRWAIGIGGGIAFLLIIAAGFAILTSQGNPQRLQGGKDLLTSALSGLLLLIFSIFLLRLIGVDILKIPEFGGP